MTELQLKLVIFPEGSATIFYREPTAEELGDAWEMIAPRKDDNAESRAMRRLEAKKKLGQVLITHVEIDGERIEKPKVAELFMIALGHFILGNLEDREGES